MDETPKQSLAFRPAYQLDELSSYQKYYQKHREEIFERYKSRRPYKEFYQKHKARLQEQALHNYYEKKLQRELSQLMQIDDS